MKNCKVLLFNSLQVLLLCNLMKLQAKAQPLTEVTEMSSKASIRSQVNQNLFEGQLKELVIELGENPDRIPADFSQKVHRWARLYQTRDRADMARLLGPQRRTFYRVREQFRSAELHPDLALVALVESNFETRAMSDSGHAGLWQFEPVTARKNGLKVGPKLDERFDPEKSTQAACRYLNTLSRTLGPHSSWLTVIAAYNLGPSRLQSRVKQLSNPQNTVDFWHLYETRTIPALTRTHIARLVAAILVSRNETQFGFGPTQPSSRMAQSEQDTPANERLQEEARLIE